MSKKQKKELRKIITGIVIFAILFTLEKLHVFPAKLFGVGWYLLIPYLVPYFIAGWPVVRGCIHGIRNGQWFDEKFLMTIATLGAFVTGEYSEAVAVMLFYQVGEFFQDYAVNKSRGSIKALMEIAPDYANRENEDGSIEVIDPDDVEIGDILIIKPGEKVPVDGTVIEGRSMVNTSALTGESVPRSVKEGEQIISGCINGDSLLKVRADKEYDDSTVAQILEMVEDAAEKKSHTENFITRFARYYTPIVVFGAIALWLIPGIITHDWMKWMLRACTFLVISCPCALVISVPLAFFGGIGAASKQGVLVKGSNYLELMASVDTMVTDKTGTLTKGEFKVSRLDCADGVTEEELLSRAAAVESDSTHPIAVSICEAAKEKNIAVPAVKDVQNVSGEGVYGTIDGLKFYVGNAKLMMEFAGVDFIADDDPASTVVNVAEEGRYLGSIAVSDTIKPEAKSAIAEMKKEGIRNVVMLTGDRESVGTAVGRELGVDTTYSDLMPQDKVSKVEELLTRLGAGDPSKEKNRRRLAFVGDGINDAPVLSRADVGIAMGSMGSDAAIEAADVVIMDDDLRRIPIIIRIARRTLGISRQNIVFAIAVKIAFLIMGALGIADMWGAVFADVGVAIICILNSMRMLNYRNSR